VQNSIRPVAAPRELGVFGAMWRYRWVVVTTVLLTVLAALAYDLVRSRPYVADASLILQPPAAAGSAETLGAQEAARYAQDQVTILRSPALVARALEATREQVPGEAVTEDDIRDADIEASTDSNVISIRFSGDDPRLAAAAANAIGESYGAVRREQLASASAASIQRIDRELGTINSRLREIDATSTTDETQAAQLEQERDSLLEERSALLQQRAQSQVALSAPDQSAIFIPVDLPVNKVGSERIRLLAVAVFLGLVLGGAIAYALALRRRNFADADEIEMVVEAPLLGEIPNLAAGRRSTGSSELVEAGSAGAEAFRLIASAVGSRNEQEHVTTVMVVSADRNDGKTTVVANTAAAAAREGVRVLVVDADSRSQGLSWLFESLSHGSLMAKEPSLGGRVYPGDFGTVVGERTSDGLERVLVLANATIDLLSLSGTSPGNAWRSDASRKYFQSAREVYDLVLLDTPDLLSASDAASIALHADAAVVVVPKQAAVAGVSEVVARLRLLGVTPIGYVHNTAPSSVRRNRRRAD
jgi:Mrp family chromosome partitioning ATPase